MSTDSQTRSRHPQPRRALPPPIPQFPRFPSRGRRRSAAVRDADRVIIFDTTLRDGEQSPGASMNLGQKLQVARALSELGVDVIEAGFAAASPGDLEAIAAVGREIEADRREPRALHQGRHRRVLEGAAARAAPPLPRLPRHLAHPPRLQAEAREGRDHPPRGGRREARARALRGRRVLHRGLRPHRARVPRRGGRAGDRGRRRDREHPGHGRLRAAVHVRRDDPLPQEARPRHRRRDRLGPLPQRPRPRRREQPRGRDGGRAAGGVHDQRDRRARRERVARGDRHGVPHAPGRPEGPHRREDRAALPDEPARLAGHRPARPAEQGHRRAERVRARGRHPPARDAHPPRDLRDHAAGGGRVREEPARPRQALRAPRAEGAARRARLHARRRGVDKVFQDFKVLADKKKDIYDADIEALVVHGQILAEGSRAWELEALSTTSGTGTLPVASVALRSRDGERHRTPPPATAPSMRCTAPSRRSPGSR